MNSKVFVSRRDFIKFSGIGLAALSLPATAQPKKNELPEQGMPGYPGIHIGDSFENHMQVLNYWGEQSPAVRKLYERAFNILSSKQDATFADVAADPEFQQICGEAGILHLGGPMLGAVSPNGAWVWLRTVRPAKVEIHLTTDGKEKTFGPVESTAETDLTAVVEVTGLNPSTSTPYQVLVDGKPINIPPNSAIITTSSAEKPAETRIAFGSCFHTRLGNTHLTDTILSRKPAACLLLGDIAADDKKNHLGLARTDYLLRDFLSAWRNLAAKVPIYAVWDDHDYFANDISGVPQGYDRKDMEEAWGVFRRAYNNPSYGFNDDRRGLFLRTRIGACDIIMLDTRYFRTGTPRKKNCFLGQEQMQWLETKLLDCKGPFIIISSGTMWSDYVSNGKDSWGVWDPEARDQIFNLIEKNRIGGVLLISGDRHGACGFRIPRPSGYEFYEFEAACLGGWKGPVKKQENNPKQLFGLTEKTAFGEFTFDAALPDPEVVFRLIGDTGDVIYELKLARSQLMPGHRRME